MKEQPDSNLFHPSLPNFYQMTQKMLGYISDLITIVGLVYMILLIHGFVQLKPEQQEKFDNVLESRGTLLKILVYGATAIFTVHFILKFF